MKQDLDFIKLKLLSPCLGRMRVCVERKSLFCSNWKGIMVLNELKRTRTKAPEKVKEAGAGTCQPRLDSGTSYQGIKWRAEISNYHGVF